MQSLQKGPLWLEHCPASVKMKMNCGGVQREWRFSFFLMECVDRMSNQFNSLHFRNAGKWRCLTKMPLQADRQQTSNDCSCFYSFCVSTSVDTHGCVLCKALVAVAVVGSLAICLERYRHVLCHVWCHITINKQNICFGKCKLFVSFLCGLCLCVVGLVTPPFCDSNLSPALVTKNMKMDECFLMLTWN